MQTFEALCANAEAVAVDIENLAKQLQRSARALKKAAREGSPGKIRQAAGQIDEAASKTRQIDGTASRAWPLSDDELTRLLKGPYIDQLIEAARLSGVMLNRLDDCLAAFPVILEVLPGQRALRLNTARLTTLHPSVVIKRIRDKLKRSPRRPEKFIEVLFNAYKRVVGDRMERGTTLLDVYKTLTLDPDYDYGKADFTRDVYELDSSGVRQTRSGATMSLPAATGTRSKGDTLSFISLDGTPKYYFGIRFEQGF